MGHKVNPHGLRVGVIKDWDSRWFAKDNAFGDILVEDYQLRKYLKKRLYDAGVPKIEIERDATKVKININCSRPGVVIGRQGAEIEKVRLECEKMVNKNRETPVSVFVNVVEVKSADNTRAKSLKVYMDTYKPAYAIKLSAKNFGFEDNKKIVPLYAAFCI